MSQFFRRSSDDDLRRRRNKERANQKRKMHFLWSRSDLSFDEICEEMEMTEFSLAEYAASLGLGAREDPDVYVPTPEQIEEAAIEIRMSWSDTERELRLR